MNNAKRPVDAMAQIEPRRACAMLRNAVTVIGCGMLLALCGCVSLPGFTDLNELPGFRHVPLREALVYDQAILAYRLKVRGASDGPVLRNAAGMKIQTQEDLDRSFSSRDREVVGAATKSTAYLLAALYLPYNAVVGAFGILPSLPLIATAPVINGAWRDAAEADYRSGRAHFARGESPEALKDWNRAKVILPNLQAESDIDYWRGRALEEVGQQTEAFLAYHVFLRYSERTRPDFFRHSENDEMTWGDVATDIEKRLVVVKDVW